MPDTIAGDGQRDEILAFAAELLDLGSFPDYGPQGMQVAGADEVTKVVCAVSSSLELFERAAAAGAAARRRPPRHPLGQRAARDRRGGSAAGSRRSSTPTSRSPPTTSRSTRIPEVGNNALLARELGVEVDGAVRRASASAAALATPRDELLDRDPRADRPGAARLRATAPSRSSASRSSPAAARGTSPRRPREGYDLYLTGEPAEPSLHLARELGITFVAAGHYATERLGVQALAARLAERFGLEWEFVELPNPV